MWYWYNSFTTGEMEFSFLKITIYIFTFFCNLSALVFCDVEQSKTIKLPNGNRLIGLEQVSFPSKRPFLEFRGIPYAQPPTGSLRFKAPLSYKDRWNDPRDATKYGSVCPQDDVFNGQEEEGNIEELVQPIGSEDCLFINVATPKKRPSVEGYPVLVWIHGGSFQYESGDVYNPNKFLDFDVTVVTFNFRIGALGFLNTGDGKIQGNNGLKDQVLALEWVRDNIAAFGGNPNAVTLMGVNSGAVSAHLHMLSPMSEGLFHRVVLQSGTALSPWALQKNATNTARMFHTWFDCEKDNETLPLHHCLMGQDVETILRKQPRLTEWFIDPLAPFGPSIETIGDEPKFLEKDPYEILASGEFWSKGKVSLIAGVNSHEGLLHSWDIAHHRILYQVLTREWQRALPISLSFRETALSLRTVCDSVYDFYFEEEPQPDEKDPPPMKNRVKEMKDRPQVGNEFYKFDELTQMYSDRNFFIPLHKTVELHAKDGNGNVPVYLYWFDYKGSQSSTQFSKYNETIVGASHFDQIQYIFTTPYFQDPEQDKDVTFGRRYLAGLVRFIQTGEPPADNWSKMTEEMLNGRVPFTYNRIGDANKQAPDLTEPFRKSVEFWDKLPLLEYGKTAKDFPEFTEERIRKEKEEDEEVIPGVSKKDVEELKAKHEL